MSWYGNSLIKESGILEPPPAMEKAIYDWCISNVDSFLLLNRLSENRDDKKLNAELAPLLKKYFPDGDYHYLTINKSFKIDLKGWKYEHLISDKLDLSSSNNDNNFDFYNDPFPKTLDVEMSYRESYESGNYDYEKNKLNIYINNKYKNRLEIEPVLKIVIRHELSHFAQELLSNATKSNVGNPQKNIRDNLSSNSKKLFYFEKKLKSLGIDPVEILEIIHSLKDVEFLPDIMTAYDVFMDLHSNSSNLVNDFKIFINDYYLFQHLKKYNIKKYNNAIKIFYKMVFGGNS